MASQLSETGDPYPNTRASEDTVTKMFLGHFRIFKKNILLNHSEKQIKTRP